MLLHPTIESLKSLRLLGMVKALENQLSQPEMETMSFEARLGFMVDREINDRENRRLQTRLRYASLKHEASMEDIDYRPSRELDKKLLLTLSNCQWVKAHRNVLIIGATGAGKSYLACALAHKACLEGNTVYYSRLSTLLSELILARGDGSYTKRMAHLAKTEVLILDDLGLAPFTNEQRRDLLEIIDDRYERRSTIVTSQLPVKTWHDIIGDKTLADAILDRLVHNAYRLDIQGDDSMRRIRANNFNKEGK